MSRTADDERQRPSKSERKREAQAAQELGEALVELDDAELDALELPEALRDAIAEARRITSRAAGARQRQYIGKLMRSLDLGPVRAALAARDERNAREARRFRRIEEWRERLIAEGAPALAELAQRCPQIDRTLWERRIAAAADERRRTGSTGPAARELFRALREILDRPAPGGG